MQHIIEITNGVPRHPLYRMNHPVNLTIASGEQVAIVGSQRSGKSRLVDIITGRYPLLLNEVRYDFSPSPLKLVSEKYQIYHFPRFLRRQRRQLLLPTTLEPTRH